MKKISLIGLVITLILITAALISCGGDCDHEWDEGVATKEATCTENGITTYTCTKCGETKRIATDPAPHTNTEISVISATCTSAGEKTLLCSVCDTVTTEEIPVRDHIFSVRVSSVTATCTLPGKVVKKCLTCDATNTEESPATGKHEFYTSEEYMMIKKVPTPSSIGEKVTHCKTCTLEQAQPYLYSEYARDLQTAEYNLKNVDLSSFKNKSISTFSTTKYSKPSAYPTAGEHPRLLINTTTLNDIRAAILRPENAGYLNDIIKTANEYSSGLLGDVTEHTSSPKGEHNLNESIYDTVMAKSFLYLLTGAKIYAYDAIRMTKEYMSTIKIVTVNPDPERNWGFAMFAAAIVYDWCYDVLTETDKADLVRGIEWRLCKTITSSTTFGQNLEIGFPPAYQGAVCGHGSERQLLRDYLSVALAIYDEYPTWYEYIGGRFFEDYVPVRNEFYKSGMYPQGISVYVQIRFTSDLWSAWIMQSATGENPYSAEMARVIPSLFSRIVDGNVTIFDEGDCEGKSDQEIINGLCFAASISAYLFNDSVAASWSNYFGNRYTGSLNLLILKSTGVEETRPRHEGLDLVCYNGGFLNEIVAHSDWGSSATSVLMKIGGRSTANHDHGDAGSFQIYYKGILAGDTGFYDSYGTDHFKQYHQATIAHNSIVIYRDGATVGQKVGSAYREPTTYDEWMSDAYHTANLTGVSYGYMDEAKTAPKYTYISGDIAPAYQGVITKGDRRMLAVFDTQNPDVPLYFFVYDNFIGNKNSDAMTFLLHTKSQPTINGNTVSAFSGSGKIVLQNVKGGDKIEAIGGVGKNFMVNGSQVNTKDGENDGYWGRVEISTQNSSKNDVQLNAIYVTDTTNKTACTAHEIFGDVICGAIMGNTVAVFVEESTNYSGDINFSTAGAGDSINYYISGVAAGTWHVMVGTTSMVVTAAEGEGLLHFTAPSGLVSITPVN